MYEIRKVNPLPIDKRKDSGFKSKFPFATLNVGEGFFVPNKLAMPPAELLEKASTLRNMQTHCNYQNKKKDKVFRAALYDTNWIQVWRES
mgnify:FL=1